MKGKTGFALGIITTLLAAGAGAVALNRSGHNIVDELDSRIPNPLFPKKEISAEKSEEVKEEPVVV
jgi:hypothetical protein